MADFEFFGEPYLSTGPADMDPILRSKIIAFAEDGHDLEALEEVFGPENVRLAAINNGPLQDLLEKAIGDDHAS